MYTYPTPEELERNLAAAREFEQRQADRQRRLDSARLNNRQRPEAARFGTFNDWTPEDVDYLLEELRAGHYADSLHQKNGGWLLASSGLAVAQIATEFEDSGKLKRVLPALVEGLRWQLENEMERLPDDDDDGPVEIARAEYVLNAIGGDYDQPGGAVREADRRPAPVQ